MDFDQVLKQLEWLNEERRKDKDIISKQVDRITAMEGSISGANQQIKELSSEITRLSTVVNRMDEFDSSLLQQRLEINKQVEELMTSMNVPTKDDIDALGKKISDLDKKVSELKKAQD